MDLPQAQKLLQESLDLLRFSRFDLRVCGDAGRMVVGPDKRAITLKVKKHPHNAETWCLIAFQNDEAIKMFCNSCNAADVASFVSDTLFAAPRTGY